MSINTISYLTYDGDPTNGVLPFRPSLAEVGGAAKLDHPDFPPGPDMASAAEYNEMSMLFPALARVTGVALLYVSNSGAALITGLRGASSVLTDRPLPAVPTTGVNVCGDFTVTRHAAGDVEIQASATKLIPPFACLAFPQVAGDFLASARLNGTGDGVRIETRNKSSGVLSDVDVVIWWM